MRLSFRLAALLCVALLASASGASAQDTWPARPVRIVVPYTPGGGIDVLARILGQRLGEAWGQPVVIENRPGAGGTIGPAQVAKSASDGYSFVIVSNTFALGASGAAKQPYDALKDFAPVILATRAPFVLGVYPGLHVKDVRELLALARSKPGGLNFASAGTGTGTHLAIELLKHRTGMPALHVPYKGTNPALQDLIDGRVDALFGTPAAIMPLASDNRVQALATTGRARTSSAPGVPTMIESGVPDFEVVVWFGLLAPAGTPPAILRKFHADALKVLDTPDVMARLKAQGQEVVGMGPDEFSAYLRSEIATWGDIVRQADIRFE
jgi:tripartite-type tricarboxylate transporter receptor subunit TctC